MKQKYNYEFIPDVVNHGASTAVTQGSSCWRIVSAVTLGVLSIVAYVWVIDRSLTALTPDDSSSAVRSDNWKNFASILPPLGIKYGVSRSPAMEQQAASNAVENILKDLADQIEGRIVWYDNSKPRKALQALGVWNLDAGVSMASVIPATEHDVQLAVPVLRQLDVQYRVPFRIKSGGHNYAGFSSVKNGIVLSLERLTALDFDVKTGVATLGPAVTVQQLLDQVLVPFHYTGVIGSCPGVAIGGFALSGGFGLLSRKYGLGVDSILSLRAVLADGTLVTASNDTNPDLFWALRGAGGGSFAVVTALEYQLHSASDEVLFGAGEVKVQEMPATLVELGKRSTELPGEITFSLEGMVDKNGKTDFMMTYMASSVEELDSGEAFLSDEIKALFPEETMVELYRASLAETTRAGGDFEGNLVRYWNGYLYTENNTEEVWGHILKQITGLCQEHYPYIMVDIELWGGTIAKISVNETAFGHRTPVYNVGIGLLVPVDDQNARREFSDLTKTADKVWSKVSEYLVGSYTNYQMDSLAQDAYAAAYWGNNLERLQKAKENFDPANAFCHEQSVPLP